MNSSSTLSASLYSGSPSASGTDSGDAATMKKFVGGNCFGSPTTTS
jgi:hypothetical protein